MLVETTITSIMAPAHSKLRTIRELHQARVQAVKELVTAWEPAMQLKAFPLKQTSHKNGMVTSIKVPVDPTINAQEWNSSNTVEVKFPVCNTNGEPKACIEFRTNLEHLAQSFGDAFTIEKQKQIIRACLGPNTCRIYQEEWDSLVEDNAEAEEEDQLDGEQMMHLAFNALAKDAFPNPEDAASEEKHAKPANVGCR